MSVHDILTQNLILKLPEGALRQLVDGGDEELLMEALADAIEPGYDAMAALAYTRDPDNTTDLETLEREYGFLPNEKLTEQERRDRIKALKYAKAGSGSGPSLEEALHLAGFTTLIVGEGTQAIDPATFIPAEGEYVVNGFEYLTIQGYGIGCNETESPPGTFDYDYGCSKIESPPFSGNYYYPHGCKALASVRQYVNYVPTDNFHLVFYVAQSISYDGSGNITAIIPATIPGYYRDIIREIILRLKPIHTWCYLAVDWTYGTAGVDHFGFGFFPMGISPHGV